MLLEQIPLVHSLWGKQFLPRCVASLLMYEFVGASEAAEVRLQTTEGLAGISGGHLVQLLLQQGAQDHVQVASEDLQQGETPQPLRATCASTLSPAE